jgi:hypothetical protein
MDMDRMKKRNATHAPDSDQNAIGNTMWLVARGKKRLDTSGGA